ncbi:hypothetical protein Taro_048148 [Colocasia esculenta]|uniref:Uncharacterized protein n=1 Tax=Colocasia esculenta TaxID=4460 RepID=A0A843X4V0_COLES|nr:hypothetical protein [Colocasia esculenta]
MENLVATGSYLSLLKQITPPTNGTCNPQPKNMRNHPTSMKNTKNRNLPAFPPLHTRSSRREDTSNTSFHVKSPSEARNSSPPGQTEHNQLYLASRV